MSQDYLSLSEMEKPKLLLLQISGAEAGLVRKCLQSHRKMAEVELGHWGIYFINSAAVNLPVIMEDCKAHCLRGS